jgi:D-glycero-alpha-D-manno-heptose-7-phosphate kinase
MSDLVISQTPYRISLGGGGTDLPFYANEKGGRLITAAINQYVKVSAARRPLDDKILIQTTDVQFATNLDEIDNKIIGMTLRYFKLNKGIQVGTFTTLPSGIGLGSSSTVIVGLINTLSKIIDRNYSSLELAKLAYHIEREVLCFAGGVQDQYIAAIGGIQILDVKQSGEVICTPLMIDEKNRFKLQKHLVLIYTGQERFSSKIIKSQKRDLKRMFEVYDEIKEIGRASVDLLKNADIEGLGNLMDRHWEIKRTLSKKISTSKFDELYLKFKDLGSPGGKIIGAGGGGFFMMAVPDNVKLFITKINALGFKTLNWNFEFNGSHILES